MWFHLHIYENFDSAMDLPVLRILFDRLTLNRGPLNFCVGHNEREPQNLCKTFEIKKKLLVFFKQDKSKLSLALLQNGLAMNSTKQ